MPGVYLNPSFIEGPAFNRENTVHTPHIFILSGGKLLVIHYYNVHEHCLLEN